VRAEVAGEVTGAFGQNFIIPNGPAASRQPSMALVIGAAHSYMRALCESEPGPGVLA